jgi:hypothetical protein
VIGTPHARQAKSASIDVERPQGGHAASARAGAGRLQGCAPCGEQAPQTRRQLLAAAPQNSARPIRRDKREPARTVRDLVRLTWTVPTYGGRRWWFLCPRTNQMTSKLYLLKGGWHFWSRDAYGL